MWSRPRSRSELQASGTASVLLTWWTSQLHRAHRSTRSPPLAWSSLSPSASPGTNSSGCTSRRTPQGRSACQGLLHTNLRLNSWRRQMLSTRCDHPHHMRPCSMTLRRSSPDQGNMTGRRQVRIKTGSILVPDTSHQGMPWYPSKERDLKTMTRRGRGRYQDPGYIRTSRLKCGETTVLLSSGHPRDQNWLTGHPRVR